MRRSVLTLMTSVILLTITATGVSAAVPSNDRFGKARAVAALPYTNTLNTTEATNSTPDPECSGGDVHTVWYRFTASADGPVLAAVSARFDATVSVYTGTRDDLEPVACADDPPSLAFDARSGTTYHIMVASCCGEGGGRATLTLAAIERPTLVFEVGRGTADTRTGDAKVRGVVTCDNAATASISVQVRQRNAEGLIVVGYAFATAPCDGTQQRWKTLVLSDRAFEPGWARVIVSAQACKRDICAADEENRVIPLEPRPTP